MKLLKKRTVFVSSADGNGGDKGEFSVQMPLDYVFDEKIVFKMFISQINIRNSFFAVNARNCHYYMQLVPVAAPIPAFALANPQLTGWQPFDIPFGFPSSQDVAACVNAQLQLVPPVVGQAPVSCQYIAGRLYFNQVAVAGAAQPGAPTVKICFYFASAQGPCNDAVGFHNLDTGVSLVPDTFVDAAGVMTINPVLPSTTVTPRLMNVDNFQNILVRTSIPSDNYTVGMTGPSASGVTVQVPMQVPPGGAIVYTDDVGVNAIYERSKSVVNNLSVELMDEAHNKIVPDQHWTFVLTIEQYEDVHGEILEQLQQQTSADTEIMQLLKMLLLQSEYKSTK